MNYCRNLYSCFICIAALVLCTTLSWSCSPPAVIKSFNASPTVINSGQAATLQWEVTGTTRVNINNGVGTVAAAGKAIVTPKSTTTYLLTLPDDTQSIPVTIEVRPAPAAGTPEKPAATGPDTVQAVTPPAAVSTLRYDNLDASSEDYLSRQIAVWHTYAKLPGSTAVALSGYSGDTHRTFSSSTSTGIPVKSPLIILPAKDAMFCIVKNYSSLSYQYLKVGSSWYGDAGNESDHLGQPGWGLMTAFSPAAAPFRIQRINMAAAANISDPTESYDKFHFVVRILDADGKQVWSTLLPWSLFKGDTSAGVPKAAWKGIDVPDIAVNGDFSVEVLTESKDYEPGKAPNYLYLALAYEEILSKNVSTRSSISDAGGKSDNWVRLYDTYGQPLAFNLCIRVDGTYPGK
jgi:hypothetical protein